MEEYAINRISLLRSQRNRLAHLDEWATKKYSVRSCLRATRSADSGILAPDLSTSRDTMKEANCNGDIFWAPGTILSTRIWPRGI